MKKPHQIASIEEIDQFISGDTPDIKTTLAVSTDWVLLSRYTANKQQKHPEITANSFSWLQDMLDHGDRLYDKRHHSTIIYYRENPYIAVLKATTDGSELYLQSFRRSDAKNIASLRKRVGCG